MTSDADAVPAASVAVEPPAPASPIVESRWPPVLVLLLFMALHVTVHVWFPHASPVRVPWLVPAAEGVLLVVLLTVDPARHAGRRRGRIGVLSLVCFLVLAALWTTGILIRDLVDGIGVANNPRQLLATAAVVWLGNNLAFAMLYWLMDSGGPIARSRSTEPPVDFAFTQQMSPEISPAGWRPVFLDYLHLGFTNATAFSPTDVMPLTHRAKYAMVVQSSVALALFALVVARAVNAFT